MINKGQNQNRFTDNPIEKSYADEWEGLNTATYSPRADGRGTLDYLLATNTNHPMGEVTDRDREVAATVIQWLGSPCGQAFIQKIQDLW